MGIPLASWVFGGLVLTLGSSVVAKSSAEEVAPVQGAEHVCVAPAQDAVRVAQSRIVHLEASIPFAGTTVHADDLEPAGGLEAPVDHLLGSGFVHLPRGFVAPGDTFDLVLHFHGGPQIVAPQLEAAGVSAAVLVVNVGAGSGAYERSIATAKALDIRVRAVEKFVATTLGLESVSAERIALSAWSAGYGAVGRLLAKREARDRIDAVLLADGLHAGFEPGGRQVDHLKMAPFVTFAEEAARGERLMAISHSDVQTYHYASTTQTADHLLSALEVERTSTTISLNDDVQLRSAVHHGGFHMVAFGGQDTDAHCDHLLNMSTTLFPLLAERWKP